MRKARKLLLVELGGKAKAFIIKELIKRNLELFLVQGSFPTGLEGLLPTGAFIEADPYNIVDLLTSVTAFLHETGIRFDGVGTYFEHAVPNTAILAQMLGLPGIAPGIAYRSSNLKVAMREAIHSQAIESPKYLLLHELKRDALEEALIYLGGDAVIKPVMGNNSHGVVRIRSNDDLDIIIDRLNQSCTAKQEEAFKNFRRGFLLESYLEGTQISVDGIVDSGTVHFAGIVEIVIGSPSFTACANFIPPRITEEQCNSSLGYCKRVLETLGFDNCGFHCELRLTDDGPVLIEIACRAPGGKIMEGYSLAYGIDFVGAMADLWLGNPVSLRRQHFVRIHQAGVFVDGSGTLESLEGLDQARTLPGVNEVTAVMKIGQRLAEKSDDPVPIYYFCVEASTYEELENRIACVKETIKFSVIQ